MENDQENAFNIAMRQINITDDVQKQWNQLEQLDNFESDPILLSVKQPMPMMQQCVEFQFNQTKVKLVADNAHKMPVFRGIRGDGNCFYRSFALLYLETTINNDDPNKQHFKKVFKCVFDNKDMFNVINNPQEIKEIPRSPNAPWYQLYRMIFLQFLKLFYEREGFMTKQEKSDKLVMLFNKVRSFDTASVLLIRALACMAQRYFSHNSQNLTPEEKKIRDNCQVAQNDLREVNIYGEQANHSIISLLTYFLKCKTIIYGLQDKNSSMNQPEMSIFHIPEEEKSSNQPLTLAFTPVIQLYYRPGHYEAGYLPEYAKEVYAQVERENEKLRLEKLQKLKDTQLQNNNSGQQKQIQQQIPQQISSSQSISNSSSSSNGRPNNQCDECKNIYPYDLFFCSKNCQQPHKFCYQCVNYNVFKNDHQNPKSNQYIRDYTEGFQPKFYSQSYKCFSNEQNQAKQVCQNIINAYDIRIFLSDDKNKKKSIQLPVQSNAPQEQALPGKNNQQMNQAQQTKMIQELQETIITQAGEIVQLKNQQINQQQLQNRLICSKCNQEGADRVTMQPCMHQLTLCLKCQQEIFEIDDKNFKCPQCSKSTMNSQCIRNYAFSISLQMPKVQDLAQADANSQQIENKNDQQKQDAQNKNDPFELTKQSQVQVQEATRNENKSNLKFYFMDL